MAVGEAAQARAFAAQARWPPRPAARSCCLRSALALARIAPFAAASQALEKPARQARDAARRTTLVLHIHSRPTAAADGRLEKRRSAACLSPPGDWFHRRLRGS